MNAVQAAALLLATAAGTGVALTREPSAQAIGLSFFGAALALLFFTLQAPDVALSQIVIGALALPLMILLALARMRRNQERRR